MPPIEALLSDLRRRDIRLWREGERLRFAAPAGALPGDVLATLKERKAEIMAYLAEAGAAAERAATPMARVADDRDLPLSFAQERLWVQDRLGITGTAYHLPIHLAVDGPLDVAALVGALEEIVARHEPLRTTFAPGDRRPVQIVHPAGPLSVTVEDVPGADAEAREAAARSIALEETRRPFDLVAGPVWRLRLLRLAADRHVIVLVVHHIAFDGWSMGILLDELAALYAARVAGRPNPLAPLAHRYADHAVWQRGRLEAEGGRLLARWTERLAGLPATELPLDRPRPATQSFTAGTVLRDLDAATGAAIRALAALCDTTPFVVLWTAFAATLARHVGGPRVAVGTPVAARTRAETEGLIGFFVNYVVLLADLGGAPTGREAIERLKSVAAEAFADQDLPFERLAQALQPERDLAAPPLARISFALQDGRAMAPRVALGAAEARLLDAADATVRFDFELHAWPQGDGYRLAALHATDLYDRDHVEGFLAHFARTAEALAARPDVPLAELSALAGETRAAVLAAGLGAEAPWPFCPPVAMVEAVAAERPEAPAVRIGAETWTYARLDREADAVAARLAATGAGPETIVGVMMRREPRLLAALLGVMKTGAAYLPLDPALPADRLDFMIADAGARIVISTGALAARLAPRAETAILDLDAPAGPLEAPRPAPALLPDNLAYVIYTSGSTGRPKGVMVSLGGFVNYLAWAREAYRMTEGAGAPVAGSIGFDATITCLFLPLLGGGRVDLVPEGEEIGGLVEALSAGETYGLVKITPAHLDAVASLLAPRHAPAAGRLVIGGEALSGRSLAWWAEHAPAVVAVNEYGPTETVVGCAIHEARPGDTRLASVPIGRAIANTRLVVLDADMEPVPYGVPGELYIGGAGVARGYLGRPDVTAERFVPDPFGPPGARLYRTGDVVRLRPDGILDYLGRNDHQVKLRGHRIEPGEIEAALRDRPEVADAIVLLGELRPGHKALIAWVTPARAARPDPAALRAAVARVLPEIMVPSAIVVLDALPLTPNGKVDRAALPAPRRDVGSATAPTTPASRPTGEAEAILARIWSDLLGLETIGRDRSFFELGGDSILAIQAVQRANAAGLALTPLHVFRHQTIAELAEVAVAARPEAAEPPAAEPPDHPPTPIQAWFFERGWARPEHYNQSLWLAVPEGLAADDLRRLVEMLAAEHAALETVVETAADGPRFSCRPGSLRLETARLGDPSAPDWPGRLATLAAEAQRGLAFAGPLVRPLAVLDEAERPVRLGLFVHHLVFDAVSWRIVLARLGEGARALAAGRPIPPARPAPSFARWATRLAREADASAQAEAPFWLALAAEPPVPLPTRPGVADPVGLADTVSAGLDEAATRALVSDLPRLHRARLEEALVGAVAEALADWTGSRRQLLTMEGHGREALFEDLDPSGTVGWFTTLHPLRVDTAAAGPAAMVRAAKEALRRVPRRGIGHGLLARLATDAALRARLVDAGLPPVLVNYLGQVDQVLDEPGGFVPTAEDPGPQQDPAADRAFPVEVSALVAGGRLRIEVRTGGRLFEPGTARRLADAITGRLARLAADLAAGARGLPGPSDFPLAALSAPALERLWREVEDIEDVYRLSPTQAGILFHALRGPEAGLYVPRISGTLTGALDLPALEAAWRLVVERHGALRTSFRWRGLGAPVQIVHRTATSPVTVEDWSGEDASEIARRFADLERRVAAAPFALDRAPLMRLALVRLGPDRHRLVWCYHHLVMDGWSTSIVFGEAIRAYAALSRGETPALPPAGTFRRHVAWLATRDGEADRRFWSERLAGFRPRPLAPAAPGPGLEPAAEVERRVARAPLEALARRAGVTLQTVVQGALGLLLAERTGSRDVGLGLTLAGRPAENREAERTVGLFIVTVPVRIGVRDGRLGPWLADLLRRQAETEAHSAAPLTSIRAWSGLPRGQELFDLLLVFENYPLDAALGGFDGLTLDDAATAERTHYPLVLTVLPGEDLILRFTPDPDRFDPAGLDALVDRLSALLAAMAGDPEAELATLAALPAVDTAANPAASSVAEPRRVSGGDEGSPPRGETEAVLAAVWADILGLPSVERDVSFFELGGHSLTSIQVVVRVRDVFGLDLPVNAVFDHPTVAALAAEIDRRLRRGGDRDRLPLVALPRPADRAAFEAPLSFGQERLWFLDRLDPGSTAYTMAAALRAAGPLDPGALGRALAALVARHEILRTRFPEIDGAPVQRIEPVGEAPLAILDLRELPAETRSATALEAARRVVGEPFDLTTGPLLRALLVRLDTEEHLFALAQHHIVSDGWSIGTMVGELAALYAAEREGRPAALPQPVLHYADFAAWQRELVAETGAESLAYWRERLAGLPDRPPLPGDRPRPAVKSHRGDTRAFVLPEPTIRRLDALARRAGATRFMVLAAGFAALLARWSGETDIAIGTPVANRGRAALEPVLGFFVNTLVLRVDAAEDPDGETLVARVRDRALEAYRHQDLPFEAVVEALAPARRQDRTPLFQVMFVLQNAPNPAVATEELRLEAVDLPTGAAKFDLTLSVTDGPGDLAASFEYDADLFDPATVNRLAAHFVRLLDDLAARPDAPLSTLGLMAPIEREATIAAGRSAAARACAETVAVDLGHPTAGLAGLRVLDRHGEPQPFGVPGDLVLVYGASADPSTTPARPDRHGPPGAVIRATGRRARMARDGSATYADHPPAAPVADGPLPADEPPAGATETRLAAILSEVLGLGGIARHTSFFEAGGHSLSAARATVRIREAFGLDLPLRALFETPTVAGLAAALGDRPTVTRDPVPTPAAAPRPDRLPLSHAEERLWLLHGLDPTGVVQNLPAALRLAGPLDREALARAWDGLVARHEALRSRIVAPDGEPRRLVDPPRAGLLAMIDLADLEPAPRSAEVDAILDVLVHHRFDLADEWPARALLISLGPDAAIFAMVAHHVALDGWSLGILFSDLARLYEAETTRAPAALPPAPQPADVALAERAAPLDPDGRHLAFWRQTLDGAPEVLDLPLDRPRPPVAGHRGAVRPLPVPPGLTAAVERLAARSGTTAFMVLHAAFALTLSRHAGTRDVVIGTPLAGRDRVADEGVVGLFARTLALRTIVDERLTVVDFLAAVRDADLAAFAHQALPFERLVGALNVPRRTDRTPVFQVLLSLENTPRPAAALVGLDAEAVPLAPAAARHDLSLLMRSDEGRLSGAVEYATDLFEPETIDALGRRFLHVLSCMAAAPETRLRDIPSTDTAEAARLVATGPALTVPWPTLQDPFERQAAVTPHAEALVTRTASWSFADLDGTANRIAHLLIRRGVRPGDTIGLAMPRGPALIAGALGILKAGAAYLPLEPDLPAGRLAAMVTDAGARAVLTGGGLALPGGSTAIDLAAEADALAAEPASRPDVPIHPRSPAYVIFTSGSTGRPKGVAVPHRAAANLVAAMAEAFPLGRGDRAVAAARLGFDISVAEIFPALSSGATVLLLDESEVHDPARFAAALAEGGATVMQATPTVWRMLLDAGWRRPPGLRLGVGGEALDADLLARLTPDGSTLVNLYGPTETTVWSSAAPTSGGEAHIAIGRPLANTRLVVLDDDLRLVPEGVPGELFVGGDGVATGYVGRPDLTAERFLPDPWGPPGSRLYRTGDRVVRRADGSLVHLGRVDFQVKIRGQRIELGEIEAALRTHPAVADAVAGLTGGGETLAGGGETLAAWLVAADPAVPPDPSDLARHLAMTLPDAMIPRRFAVLDRLPVNRSGKVDRRALPVPGAEPTRGGSVPRSALELRILQAFETVLGLEGIGVEDDFFALGGHSLAAARLAATLRRREGIALALADLFRAPTAAALAALLRDTAPPRRLVPIRAGGDRPPLVLVHPAGGSILAYRHLVAALPPDLPVQGLEAPGSEPGETPFDDLAAMADSYAAEMRAARPGGPHRLAGWSMGGIVAAEVARRLAALGETVDFLAILDVPPEVSAPDPDEAYARSLIAAFAAMIGVSAPSADDLDEAVTEVVTAGRRAGVLPDGFGREDADRQWAMRVAHDRALSGHAMGPLPLAPLLVEATEGRAEAGWLARAWAPFAPFGSRTEEVAADHMGLVDPPFAERVAAILVAALDGGA